jgi:hypothetical protein
MKPEIQVETVQHPQRYAPGQLKRAMRIAEHLCRGRLVLCEPPHR